MHVMVHARMISNVTGFDSISTYNPAITKVPSVDDPLSELCAYATAQFNHLPFPCNHFGFTVQPTQSAVLTIKVDPPLCIGGMRSYSLLCQGSAVAARVD